MCIHPGEMQFTVIENSDKDAVSACVRAVIPPFDAEYGSVPDSLIMARVDEMLLCGRRNLLPACFFVGGQESVLL